MSSKTRFTLLALALLATVPAALEAQAKSDRPVQPRTKAMAQASNNFAAGRRSASGGALSVGGSQSSALDNSDEQLDDGTPAELWTLDLRAGDLVVITLTSSSFDTQVALIDPETGFAIENDDAGPGDTNSAIVFRATAARQVGVIATAFDASGRGNYTIQVTRVSR